MSWWEERLVLVAGGVDAGVFAFLSPAVCCQNTKVTLNLKVFISCFLDSKCISYKTGATHRDYWIYLLHLSVVFPLSDNSTMSSLASKEARHSDHSKHSRSSASDPDGFSRCHHPGWWPRCSSLYSLSSRLLRCSCLTGKDACCHCSAEGGRGDIGHCRLLNSKEEGELPTC